MTERPIPEPAGAHAGFPIRCRTRAEIDRASEGSISPDVDAILRDALDDAAEQRRRKGLANAIASASARPATGRIRAASRHAGAAFVIWCGLVGVTAGLALVMWWALIGGGL